MAPNIQIAKAFLTERLSYNPVDDPVCPVQHGLRRFLERLGPAVPHDHEHAGLDRAPQAVRLANQHGAGLNLTKEIPDAFLEMLLHHAQPVDLGSPGFQQPSRVLVRRRRLFVRDAVVIRQRGANPASFASARTGPVPLRDGRDLDAHHLVRGGELPDQRTGELGLARVSPGRTNHEHVGEFDHSIIRSFVDLEIRRSGKSAEAR